MTSSLYGYMDLICTAAVETSTLPYGPATVHQDAAIKTSKLPFDSASIVLQPKNAGVGMCQ